MLREFRDVFYRCRRSHREGAMSLHYLQDRSLDSGGGGGAEGEQPATAAVLRLQVSSKTLAIVALALLAVMSGHLAVLLVLPFAYSVNIIMKGFRHRRKEAQSANKLERELPVFLEQLVLLAGAGYDLPGAFVRLEQLRSPEEALTPLRAIVSSIAKQTEDGVPFGESVSIASKQTTHPMVAHMLLYIRSAYQDGGAVREMLEELSEATQVMLEDKMDDYIARLPAHAVAPLLVAFAGLLLIFLTIPLLRVVQLMQENTL